MGEKCRWSEKLLVKNYLCDHKKVFHFKKISSLRSGKLMCDRRIVSLQSEMK